MWISPKTLCLPVLASFADYKLLDFDPASDSMTLHVCINRMVYMYVTHDTQYMYMYVRLLTLGACALGTVAKSSTLVTAVTFLAQSTGELLMIVG